MAGDLPRSHVAPLSLVLWVATEIELDLVGDGLKNESKYEDQATNDDRHVLWLYVRKAWPRSSGWIDEDDGEADNVDPDYLKDPKDKELERIPTDFVKTFVRSGFYDPVKKVRS